ncbi:MAG: hypothetical protein K5655_04525 [Lachnospiraceae bacterium]|nr:hypothetical protein [Lachnospiraceae bacterium]
MIENIDNNIQLFIMGVCFGFSLYNGVTKRSRSWVLVTLFYAAFFLGSLYWELFYTFRGDTPSKFYVAEFSWYVSYLFLFLFLRYQRNTKKTAVPCRIKWVIPVIAGGLSIYYMTFGQITSNITSALLMSLIGMESVKGLYSDNRKMKQVYVMTLVFFSLEYTLWTLSCIFDEISVSNPYYWVDMMTSLSLFLLGVFVRKALKDEVAL